LTKFDGVVRVGAGFFSTEVAMAAWVLHRTWLAGVFICDVVATLRVRKENRVEEGVHQIIVDGYAGFTIALEINHDVFTGIEVTVREVEYGCDVCASGFRVSGTRMRRVRIEFENVVTDEIGMVRIVTEQSF
jgi:hypothetical protein